MCNLKIGWILLVIQLNQLCPTLSLWSSKLSPTNCKTVISTNKFKLECSNANIAQVPSADVWTNLARIVSELDLSNNMITECENATFRDYTRLTHLDLHSNPIRYFDNECFTKLPLLKYLDIRFINVSLLSDLPVELFHNLHHLEELYMSSSCNPKLSDELTFPGSLFKPLASLRVFSMTGMNLMQFPQEFQYLKNLRELFWSCLRCQGTLKEPIFKYLNSSIIDTFSVVHKWSELENNVLDGIMDTFPHLTKLNFGCSCVKLYLMLPWLQKANLKLTHLLLDRVHYIHQTIPPESFCDIGEDITVLSLNDNNLNAIDPAVWKCLPNLKYLSLYKHKYYHDQFKDIGIINSGKYISNVETIGIAYFQKRYSTTLESDICYTKKDSKQFEDWVLQMPNLPVPEPLETHSYMNCPDKETQFQSEVLCGSLPGTLKHIHAPNINYNVPYITGPSEGVASAIIFNPNNELAVLNISNSGKVSSFVSTIHGLNKLQVADLTGVGLKNMVANIYMPNLRFFSLANNKLVDSTQLKDRFQNWEKLLSLDISGNVDMKVLDTHLLKQLNHLVTFHSDRNNLMNFDLDLSANRQLRVLTLKGNDLTHISANVTSMLNILHSEITPLDLKQEYLDMLDVPNDTILVDIRDNDLQCDCNTIDFVHWIQTTPILLIDLNELTCNFGNSQVRIMEVDIDEIVCNQGAWTIGTLAGIFSTLTVLCVATFLLLYKYRWTVKWHYYKLRNNMRINLEAAPDVAFINNDQYDAFVAHNHDVDRFWVIRTLLPRVEQEWGMKLCIGYRDFLAGGGLADTIVEHIEKSRKVILLITPAFVESQWCDFEMNMALVEKMNDIIIIYKEPVIHLPKLSATLRNMLRARLYVEWTENEDGQNYFWSKLHDAMRTTSGTTWSTTDDGQNT